MVASFAMSVLNGVGGAKLEKIIPFDFNLNNDNRTFTINIPGNYKYILFELVNHSTYDTNTKQNKVIYLETGTQMSFIYTGMLNINIIVKIMLSNTEWMMGSINENVTFENNNLKFTSIYNTQQSFIGNIYCFN